MAQSARQNEHFTLGLKIAWESGNYKFKMRRGLTEQPSDEKQMFPRASTFLYALAAATSILPALSSAVVVGDTCTTGTLDCCKYVGVSCSLAVHLLFDNDDHSASR